MAEIVRVQLEELAEGGGALRRQPGTECLLTFLIKLSIINQNISVKYSITMTAIIILKLPPTIKPTTTGTKLPPARFAR